MGTLSGIPGFGHIWATTGNLNYANNEQNNQNLMNKTAKKRIQFQPSVRVVLIPSRCEYLDANMFSLLWWEETDYTAFKSSAIMELKVLMALNNIKDSRTALKMIYQPDFNLDDVIQANILKQKIKRNYSINTIEDALVSAPPCLEDSPTDENESKQKLPAKIPLARTLSTPTFRSHTTTMVSCSSLIGTKSSAALLASLRMAEEEEEEDNQEITEILQTPIYVQHDVKNLGLLGALTDAELNLIPTDIRSGSPRAVRAGSPRASRATSPRSSRASSPRSSRANSPLRSHTSSSHSTPSVSPLMSCTNLKDLKELRDLKNLRDIPRRQSRVELDPKKEDEHQVVCSKNVVVTKLQQRKRPSSPRKSSLVHPLAYMAF